MDTSEKKALLLLKAVLFYYHGIDDEERALLARKAEAIDGKAELDWALAFIEKDTTSAQSRSQKQLIRLSSSLEAEQRLAYLKESWTEAMRKGYLTNAEMLWLLKIAKAWNTEKKLLAEVGISLL